MSNSVSHDRTIAACLTAPAAGGIAVIEVIGRDARAAVNPLLATAGKMRPLDVNTIKPDELRLCRIIDHGQVLDDAIIAAKRLPDGTAVIDISTHGGPRIVQRVLLALKASGATIVEAHAYPRPIAAGENMLEAEAVDMLARAKTRAVAAWLARAPAALAQEAQRIDELLAGGNLPAARTALTNLAARFAEVRYLLDGIRVVLIGQPNSGKSTLANALAGAEHSIVSETAGTTRDWVELPAAIDGLPVTLVDTAGIRHTEDAIELEAIRRTHDQLTTADVVVWVADQAASSELADLQYKAAGQPPPLVRVRTKIDLAPDTRPTATTDTAQVRVSALTGEGLDLFRRYLLGTVGMTGWATSAARPFTQRQRDACQAATEAVKAGMVCGNLARDLIQYGRQPPPPVNGL